MAAEKPKCCTLKCVHREDCEILRITKKPPKEKCSYFKDEKRSKS